MENSSPLASPRIAIGTDDLPRRSVLLSRKSLLALSRKSEIRAFGSIALQYALIAAAIAVSVWSRSWIVTGFVLVFIATRQHALAVMMHDAAHFSLSRNRRLNDVVSNLFCSFPFFVSTTRYRASHLAHHRLANHHDDPDLDDNTHPKDLAQLAVVLVKDLCLLSLPKQMRRSRKFGVLGLFVESGKAGERWLFVGYVALVAGAVWYFDVFRQLLLYWYLPFFTVCQVILRFRGFSEHAGRMEGTYLTGSRTIEVGWLERILFAPCHVNRHLEHHLFPSVPSHNLETLSRELRQNPEFARRVQATVGYVGRRKSVVGELYFQNHVTQPAGGLS